MIWRYLRVSFSWKMTIQQYDYKNKLLTARFRSFLDRLRKLWKTPGLLEKFVVSTDFVIAIMHTAKYRLEKLDLYNEIDIIELVYLSFILISLFDKDKRIYDYFDGSLEPIIVNALPRLVEGKQTKNWNTSELLAKFGEETRFQEFEQKLQNCEHKPEWAMDFLSVLKTQNYENKPRLTFEFQLGVN